MNIHSKSVFNSMEEELWNFDIVPFCYRRMHSFFTSTKKKISYMPRNTRLPYLIFHSLLVLLYAYLNFLDWILTNF